MIDTPPRRHDRAARPIYRSLTDPTIDFFALTGVASPDGADLEGRLRRVCVEYWRWLYDLDGLKLDHPAIQTGCGRVSRYDVRETKRHKGEHSDSPGVAAEPDEAEPSMLRFRQVEDRLTTTGELSERHFWMLRAVWRDGLPLLRPSLPKPRNLKRHSRAKLTDEQAAAILSSRESNAALGTRYGVNQSTIRDIKRGETYRDVAGTPLDPERTVAAQLQWSNAQAQREWDRATVVLYFELFST